MHLFPENFIDKDPSNMFQKIIDFPSNLLEGINIAEKAELPSTNSFENVLYLGMGGSAISGDMILSLFEGRTKIPFKVNKKYTSPGWVSKKTLVIASSYSGNTEETLSALGECIGKTDHFLPITTGGKLGEWADAQGIPRITLPAGLPPRAAFGYSFSVLFTALSRLGIISENVQALKDAGEWLGEIGKEFYADNNENPARQLALKMYTGLPVIYTSTDIWQAVGTRFRGQIEENAKILAYSSVLPEMNHNEIVGLEILGLLYPLLRPVFIIDNQIHPRVFKRMELTIEQMRTKGLDPIVIQPEGFDSIHKTLYAVHLADFTSFYLAVLNEVDPTPVTIIENLKKRLKES